MVVVQQLRSARAVLRWSIQDLSSASTVSVRTIKTIEARDGPPQCRPGTVKKLVSAFESAGIDFIGTPEDRPGIRIRHPGQRT
ncbi:transcriptional regulator [Silicimonas algicola]|nr:transcriptional regulator [Silicimonas algicola]